MSIKVDLVSDAAVEVTASEITEFVRHFADTLSVEGAFLETDARPARGRELSIVMKLADGFVLVDGLAMVAWQRASRSGSNVVGGVALHFLELKEGKEFLERFTAEREADGGLPFSVEQAAPSTDDGSPPREDALDQMMARRGDRPGTAELGELSARPGPIESEDDEDSPEFAPGFGRADLWNQEMAMPVPGQVNELLNEEAAGEASGQQAAVAGGGASEPTEPTEPTADDAQAASAPAPESPTPGAKRKGPIKMKMAADRQPSPSDDSGVLKPISSSFVEASRRASELMASDTERSHSASKPSPPEPPPPERPSTDPSPTPEEPPEDGENPALATVAVKPGELQKFLDAAKAKAESENLIASAGEGDASDTDGSAGSQAASSATGEGSLNTPTAGESSGSELSGTEAPSELPATGGSAAGRSTVGPSPGRSSEDTALSSEEPSVAPVESADTSTHEGVSTKEYQSQLHVDDDMLGDGEGEDATSAFGYPEREDRLPMVIIGGLVALILVALILWAVL